MSELAIETQGIDCFKGGLHGALRCHPGPQNVSQTSVGMDDDGADGGLSIAALQAVRVRDTFTAIRITVFIHRIQCFRTLFEPPPARVLIKFLHTRIMSRFQSLSG